MISTRRLAKEWLIFLGGFGIPFVALFGWLSMLKEDLSEIKLKPITMLAVGIYAFVQLFRSFVWAVTKLNTGQRTEDSDQSD
jgi:hypothetical protein